MIRVAAAGDVHYDRKSRGFLSGHLSALRNQADILLLAGDLTRSGLVDEAYALAQDLRDCPVPVAAVFGNHDYHRDKEKEIRALLEESGVTVLERASARFTLNGMTVGVVGAKGFGGGFPGACGTEYGEPEMKAFIRHTREIAADVKSLLEELDTAYKLVLLHYSPVSDTLLGEPKEIYPFLGSYLLAAAVDEAGADIVFHGHAHHGVEKGATAGGVPVRNVAQPVIGHAFNIYTLGREGDLIGAASTSANNTVTAKR